MKVQYIIRYEWPDGKVRYRTSAGLVSDPDKADRYGPTQSSDILNHKSEDARIVWDIEVSRERVK
jgi:hypothetical protein